MDNATLTDLRFVPSKIDVGEGNTVVGTAIVYNRESEPMPLTNGRAKVIEVIQPGAARNAILGDTLALFSHDPSAILGRTSSKTLALTEDNDSTGNASEFTVGLRDRGSYDIDFVADVQNAEGLRAAWKARTIDDYTATHYTGIVDDGTGFISDFSLDAELKGDSVVTGSFTFTVVSD